MKTTLVIVCVCLVLIFITCLLCAIKLAGMISKDEEE